MSIAPLTSPTQCIPCQANTNLSDLIATGGSASAAGELIKKAGGKTLEYLFIVSLPFLKGGDKLDAPMYAMIEAED